MCETPLYVGLVEELGDPETIVREFDEFLIEWHAARMREHPPQGCPAARSDG